MKDYVRILAKIRETPWFITSEGLDTVLSIVNAHMTGDVSIEQIQASMSAGDDRNGDKLEIINGVGILPIHGPIFAKANLMTEMSGATSLEMLQKDLRTLLDDRSVHSILFNVDSPGGTSEMLQEVGEEIYAAREVKPTYAIADSLAGSAALWLATQAENFFSTRSGSVGSLGAYIVHQDQSVADAQRGVKYSYISAGKYKTEGNPHEPLSNDTRAYIQEVVDECYGEFVDAVASGRDVTTEYVEENFGQGRMLRSKKALEVGLIDGISSYETLLNEISASKPRSIMVATPNGQSVAATMIGNTLHMEAISMSEVTDEHAPEEHANPGEPERVPDQSDKDNENRVETPPDSATTEPESSANVNDLETRLREALNLSPDVDIISAAQEMYAEVKPLRDAAEAHSQQKSFAERFPEQARRLERLEDKDRKAEAKAFANRFLNLTDSSGKPMNKGFASIVTDKLEGMHLKFSARTATIVDVTEILEAISQTGLVEYTEQGSSRTPAIDDIPEHNAYANKVMEIMEEDKVDYSTAASLAAERHPDLYEAYRSSIPGRQ